MSHVLGESKGKDNIRQFLEIEGKKYCGGAVKVLYCNKNQTVLFYDIIASLLIINYIFAK